MFKKNAWGSSYKVSKKRKWSLTLWLGWKNHLPIFCIRMWFRCSVLYNVKTAQCLLSYLLQLSYKYDVFYLSPISSMQCVLVFSSPSLNDVKLLLIGLVLSGIIAFHNDNKTKIRFDFISIRNQWKCTGR